MFCVHEHIFSMRPMQHLTILFIRVIYRINHPTLKLKTGIHCSSEIQILLKVLFYLTTWGPHQLLGPKVDPSGGGQYSECPLGRLVCRAPRTSAPILLFSSHDPHEGGDQALLSPFSRWISQSTERCGLQLSVTQHERRELGWDSPDHPAPCSGCNPDHVTAQMHRGVSWARGPEFKGGLRIGEGAWRQGGPLCLFTSQHLSSVFLWRLGQLAQGPPVGRGVWGGPGGGCRAGRTLSSAEGDGSVSPWPAQEATGVCSAAGLTTCLWCGF